MKLKKTIKAPKNYIYQQLIQSSLYDIKQQTGKTLSEKQLSGFKYEKKIQGRAAGTIKIGTVSADKEYSFLTETKDGSYDTTWKLTEITDSETLVEITEKSVAKTMSQLVSNWLTWAFLQTIKKRTMKQMLERMEKEYANTLQKEKV